MRPPRATRWLLGLAGLIGLAFAIGHLLGLREDVAVLVGMSTEPTALVGGAFYLASWLALVAVAPILVLASQFIGPRPMDLVFSPAEVLAVVLSVVIVGEIASDGESNWLEGAMLLAVYIILGISFYFLPEMGSHEAVTGAAQAGTSH